MVHAVLFTLSLHVALPISFPKRFFLLVSNHRGYPLQQAEGAQRCAPARGNPSSHRASPEILESGGGCTLNHCIHLEDRKSTRLNSSHRCTSYAVFCLKKKT